MRARGRLSSFEWEDGCRRTRVRRPTVRSTSAPTSRSAPMGATRPFAAARGSSSSNVGAPMDVLVDAADEAWPTTRDAAFGYIRSTAGSCVLIDRGDYWQCAYVIPKGTLDELQAARPRRVSRGGPARRTVSARSRRRVVELGRHPAAHGRVNRLRRWYRPGLLCIGDAAHAMSPIGGVGINLAIQDAVAAANILGPALLRGTLRTADLRAVQQRREFAAKATQMLQVLIQRHVIGRVLSNANSPLLRALPAVSRHLPFLPRIPGRLVGVGLRPEHVRGLG